MGADSWSGIHDMLSLGPVCVISRTLLYMFGVVPGSRGTRRLGVKMGEGSFNTMAIICHPPFFMNITQFFYGLIVFIRF